MKHILNDLSSDEKNRILEQYNGEKTIDVKNFKRLLESQLGNVKPLINEEVPTQSKKITEGPINLLMNTSETYNTKIGVKELPSCFTELLPPGSMNFNQVGISQDEVDHVVDAFDWPMSQDDINHVLQWAQGNGWPGSWGGNFGEFGDLSERVVKVGGLWYPAVEELRVRYNIDESFEDLGSFLRTHNELLQVRNNFLTAYKKWIDCVNK
jgi:hypothetical protein